MAERRFNPLRLALVSLVGSVALEIVLIFSVGVNESLTVSRIPSHLGAILAGGFGGWMFELIRESTIATAEAIHEVANLETSVAALTAKITYQDKALGMLLSCPRHNEVLTELIKTSMNDNFRIVPLIGTPAYTEFLKTAIEHSDGYEGIHRNLLRSYRDAGTGSYLFDLKRRSMKYKTRLFIIDDAQAEQMHEDLANDEVLDYYWRHTGAVKSYWMTVAEFRNSFPGVRVPPDLALYDRQLVIAYDENKQLLTFDVTDRLGEECRLFDALNSMINRGFAVLKEIQQPEDVR